MRGVGGGVDQEEARRAARARATDRSEPVLGSDPSRRRYPPPGTCGENTISPEFKKKTLTIKIRLSSTAEAHRNRSPVNWI